MIETMKMMLLGALLSLATAASAAPIPIELSRPDKTPPAKNKPVKVTIAVKAFLRSTGHRN